MKDITRLPNASYYVVGVIILRGKIIPVVSLRKFFGLSEKDRIHQKIMIMDIHGTTIVLIFDKVESDSLLLENSKCCNLILGIRFRRIFIFEKISFFIIRSLLVCLKIH